MGWCSRQNILHWETASWIFGCHLAEFFCWNSYKNGQDYEWNSLAAMLASLDKHLKEYDDIYSLLTNRDFSTSQSTLEGKAILIQEEKCGKRPNKTVACPKKRFGNVVNLAVIHLFCLWMNVQR